MIFDSLANASAYLGLSRNLKLAIEFLLDPKNLQLPVGRHDIDGDRVFALVQKYNTKPRSAGFWEAHQRYIDVQVVVSGTELMLYAPIQTLTASAPYDAEKDFAAFEGQGQELLVRDGQFAIFFPHDVHMPQLAASEPSPIHKIVLKVAVG